MSTMSFFKHIVKVVTPPFILDFVRKLFRTDLPLSAISYQGVYTSHSMRWLHEGHFADIHDCYRPLNPFNSLNESRLRQYYACMFAEFAKKIPGDFLSAGISFGVAPHVIYDFVNFESLGKRYHFIDPFLAVNYPGGMQNPYNTDIESVKKQYREDAPIVFHQELLPDCFPLAGLDKGLAFIHLNTAHPKAEATSLEYLYEKLNPGGFILVDDYSFGPGQYDDYDPALKKIGAKVFSLVTGQGIVQKPLDTETISVVVE